MKIKGVISDMDGVILDSEKLYVRFWCEAGQFYGFPFERKHALGIRSMARPFAIERLQGWFGDSFDYDTVRNKRIELMNAYVEKHGIEAKPDAEKLLSYLSLRSQMEASRYFEIPLGRIELAEYLCVDRSALTRELAKMKEEGLIDYDKNCFRMM